MHESDDMESGTQPAEVAETGTASGMPAGTRILLAVLLFAVLAGAGLYLRLDQLAEEALAPDAFTSVLFLRPPDAWIAHPDYEAWRSLTGHEAGSGLIDFLARNRSFDPATMPLYYSLEYAWNRYVTRSITGLRLLSVFFGMLLMPALFFLARSLYSTTAAFIAVLCLALSPVHWYYAREIRMYVLFSLLALLTVYTLVRLLQTRRKGWWAAHGAVSFLLLWTHPFAALVLFPAGLYLLFCHWRECRLLIRWGIFQAVLALPALVYIASIRFWPERRSGYMKVPGILEFLCDIVADDAVGMTWQLRPLAAFWSDILPGEQAQRMAGLAPAAGFVFLALSLAALAGVLIRRPSKKTRNAVHARALLFLWLATPPVVLLVLSLLWRPCIHPRYTIHCSFALYILFGAAIVRLPRGLPRLLAVLALVLVYGFELSLVFRGVQAPDWKKAADMIRAEAGEDELIVHHNAYYGRAFFYNLGPVKNVCATSANPEVMAEQAAFHLEERGAGSWLLIRTWGFSSLNETEFAGHLDARALEYSVTGFNDRDGLRVYHVTGGGNPKRQRHFSSPDYATGFGELALRLALKGKTACARQALEYPLDAYTPCDPVFVPLREALCRNADILPAALAVDGVLNSFGLHPAFAARALRRAIELAPEYAFAWAELGCIQAGEGQYEAALRSLEEGGRFNDDLKYRYAHLRDALASGVNVADTLAAYDLLFEAIPLIESDAFRRGGALLEEAAARDPEHPFVWMLLIRYYEKIGADRLSEDAAARAEPLLEKVAAEAPEYAAGWRDLARVHARLGKSEAAFKAFYEALVLMDPAAGEEENRILARAETARILARFGRFETALNSLEAAEQGSADLRFRYGRLHDVLAEKGDVWRTLEAYELLYQAIAAAENGDASRAARLLDQALAADPGFALALTLAGLSMAEDKPEEAMGKLREAGQLDPARIAPLVPLFEALILEKDMEKARRIMGRLRREDVFVPPDLPGISELEESASPEAAAD
jgi:tetratricopeptide (TPR) repeat protein